MQERKFKKALSLFIVIAFAISSVAQAAPYSTTGTSHLRPAAVVNSQVNRKIEDGFVNSTKEKIQEPSLSSPCSRNELEEIDRIERKGNLQRIKAIARELRRNIGRNGKILFVTATGGNILDTRNSITRVLNSDDIGLVNLFKVISIQEARNGKIYSILNNASGPRHSMKGPSSGSSEYIRKRMHIKEHIIAQAELLDDEKKDIYEKSMKEGLRIIESSFSASEETQGKALDNVRYIYLDDIHTLGLIPMLKKKYPHIKLIWAGHADYSQSTRIFLELLWGYLKNVDMIIGWCKEDFPEYPQDEKDNLRSRVHVLPVAGLNPLDCKNIELDDTYLNYIRNKHGIAKDRKVILQLGREAFAKDFYLTMRAYVRVKKHWKKSQGKVPQLVLACPLKASENTEDELRPLLEYRKHLIDVGEINRDDIIITSLILPKEERELDEKEVNQVRKVLLRLADEYKGDFGNYLERIAGGLSHGSTGNKERDRFNRTVLNHLEVNALQRIADLGVHVSILEAFGMLITELLWKGKATIASTTGGIPKQYPQDKQSQFLMEIPQTYRENVRNIRDRYKEIGDRYKKSRKRDYDSVKQKLEEIGDPSVEFSNIILKFFDLPEKKQRAIGQELKEHIQERYLILSCVLEYLKLLKSLLGQRTSPAAMNTLTSHDIRNGLKSFPAHDAGEAEIKKEEWESISSELPESSENGGSFTTAFGVKMQATDHTPKTVLINGYGVIGSKVAKALRKCGFRVVVSDISEETRDIALRDGLNIYPCAKDALSQEIVDVVVDATPPGEGMKMKKIYGDRRVIYQGGEALDIAEANFHQHISSWDEISTKKQIRVVTCNTSAMFNIFVPLLEEFNGLNINIEIENAPEHKPDSYKGIEHQAANRHKMRFLRLLPDDLKKNLNQINTTAVTSPNLRHYHMHRAIVNAPNLTADKVREILAAQNTIALIGSRKEKYEAKGEADRIYNLISPIAEHPMVVIVQVLPTANKNEIEIDYAVPHQSNVIPDNINALYAILGLLDKDNSQKTVNEILRLDEIKAKIEATNFSHHTSPSVNEGSLDNGGFLDNGGNNSSCFNTTAKVNFAKTLKTIAQDEDIELTNDARIGLFIGGPHIKGGYYYKLFETIVRQRLGINLVYLPFAIEKGKESTQEQLKLIKDQLKNNSTIVGAVITRPWKEEFSDPRLLDENQSECGAVNYIVKNRQGKLTGYAVDGKAWGIGLNHDLGYQYHFRAKKIVILGCGGAAREIALEINGRGINKVVFADIREEAKDSLRNMLQDKKIDYAYYFVEGDDIRSGKKSEELYKAIEDADIVINATGVGRGDTAGESPLLEHISFKPGQIVSDLISNTDTQILKEARKVGVKRTFYGRSQFIYSMVEYMRGWIEQLQLKRIPEDLEKRLFAMIFDYLETQHSLDNDGPDEVVQRISDDSDSIAHRPNLIIPLQRKHFSAVTVTCGIGFLPDVLQPSCGGVMFLKDKEAFQRPEIGKELLKRAISLAQDADRTAALWNTYLRGAATIIISDGAESKEQILREWAAALAKKGVLGWKYTVTSDLGTTGEDMAIIADSAYEVGLREYLQEKSIPPQERSKIEQIIKKRKWQDLDEKLLFRLGLVLPAARVPADRSIGLVSAIRMILWFSQYQRAANIIVDGFGLTGRSILRTLIKRLPEDARILGASDEKGGMFNKDGLDEFTLVKLIAEKEKGRTISLCDDYKDQILSLSKPAFIQQKADILILADRRYRLTDADIEGIRAKIVMEAVPGILSEKQIGRLYEKGILYISSLWINGEMFFDAREKVIHRLVPKERQHIRDMPLHVQSGISESALAVMFEELDRCEKKGQPAHLRLQAWEMGRKMAEEIRSNELKSWRKIINIAKILRINLEDLVDFANGQKALSWKGVFLRSVFYLLATASSTRRIFNLAKINYSEGRNSIFALSTAVSEISRQKVIYSRTAKKRAVIGLKTGDNIEKRLAAFHCARLKPLRAISGLLYNLESGATHHIRANCAHALGFIYPVVKQEEIKKTIARGLLSALGDFSEEVAAWAYWAISINGIDLRHHSSQIKQEIEEGLADTVEFYKSPEASYLQLARRYQLLAGIADFSDQKEEAIEYQRLAQEQYEHTEARGGLAPLRSKLLNAKSYEQVTKPDSQKPDYPSAIRQYLHLINPDLIRSLVGYSDGAEFAADEYRRLAIKGILNIYYPHTLDTNIVVSKKVNAAIIETSAQIDYRQPIDRQLEFVVDLYGRKLHRYQMPCLGLILVYGTEIFRSERYARLQDAIRYILMQQRLTDEKGEKFPDEKITALVNSRIDVFGRLEQSERGLLIEILKNLKIIEKDAGQSAAVAVSTKKPKSVAPRRTKPTPTQEILTKTHARYPITITNPLGLYLRITTVIVDLVQKSKSTVTLTKGNQTTNTKSLEELTKLAAEEGDTVVIEAKGEDAMNVAIKIEEILKDESLLGNIGSGIKSSSAGGINSQIESLLRGLYSLETEVSSEAAADLIVLFFTDDTAKAILSQKFGAYGLCENILRAFIKVDSGKWDEVLSLRENAVIALLLATADRKLDMRRNAAITLEAIFKELGHDLTIKILTGLLDHNDEDVRSLAEYNLRIENAKSSSTGESLQNTVAPVSSGGIFNGQRIAIAISRAA